MTQHQMIHGTMRPMKGTSFANAPGEQMLPFKLSNRQTTFTLIFESDKKKLSPSSEWASSFAWYGLVPRNE